MFAIGDISDADLSHAFHVKDRTHPQDVRQSADYGYLSKRS